MLYPAICSAIGSSFPPPMAWGAFPSWAMATSSSPGTPKSKRELVASGSFRCRGTSASNRGEYRRRKSWTGAPHRSELAAAYNQYSPVLFDGLYDPAHEDAMALLRGLFLTSFLADDALGETHYAGATSVLISSASSKTSIALALS